MTLAGLALALALAAPAQGAPRRPVHILSFGRAEHSVSDPLVEAWEGFLVAERLALAGAENIPAATNGEQYAFDAGPAETEPAAALETTGGFLLLIPPDPALLDRFEAFARRPQAYADRRPPRLGRRRGALAASGAEGRSLTLTLAESAVPRSVSWSECVALVYRLESGGKAVFLHKTRGGLGRVAAVAESLRERWGDDVLVMSRGDAFGHRSASGPAAGAALARLGVRAVVPGAAEWARLDDILALGASTRTLYLAANLKAAAGQPPLPGRAVFEMGGLRVGVFGLSAEAGSRMLSGRNARHYELTDPLTAGRAAAAALRPEADVIVALTNLTPSQNARLRSRVPGIDVIVGDALPNDPDAELETLSADDPERGPEDAALLVTADAPAVVTHLTLRREEIGGGRYGLAAREERILLDDSVPDLPGFAPFHYEAYGVGVADAQPLLPAARRLSADGTSRGGLKDLDFWRLAASLAAETQGAEAAFLPVQPVEERTTGDFPEGMVRSWFVAPDRLAVVQMPGGALAGLLAGARSTESPDAAIPPGGLRLAVGGVGSGNTVHGVPVDPRTSYRVVLTERVLAQASQFPALSQADTPVPGPALEESVVSALRQASDAGWAPDRYRALFGGGPVRESGLWRVNFRDVNVNVSNTKVVSEPALATVSNARIRGFDELLIGGVSKTDLEYLSGRAKWTNSLELEYARSRLRPPGQPEILSTPKNSLEARTSAALSVAKFPVAWIATSVGPSFGMEYEGELERLPNTRRKHKVSVLPGVELFNGTLLRTVSLSANLQRDYTPPTPVNQYGARLRALLSAPFGPGTLAGELGTRYFFLTPHDTAADLRLELEASVKLHIPFFKRFTVAPYFDFLYVQHKVTPASGYSAVTGLSLGFSRLWKPKYEDF
jgi:hypothetical protein